MAVFTVTTLNDVVNAGDGRLSLREAIGQANATTAADTIGFAAALDGGTVVLRGGQLNVTRDLTIDGDPNNDGSRVTIDADDKSRVMEIGGSSTDAALLGLVITDGYGVGIDGGGIHVNDGQRLSLIDSRITQNSAGGYYSGAQSGGGIYAGRASSVFISRSVLDNNAAGADGGSTSSGGALFAADRSQIRIEKSNIEFNFSGYRYGIGAGLSLDNAYARISDSSINNNRARGSGAGIESSGSSVILDNATVANNYSFDRFGYGSGAGIAAYGEGDLVLKGSTVTNNGISDFQFYNAGPGLYVGKDVNLTVADSIVAGNRIGSDVAAGDIYGSVSTSNGHNVFGTPVDGAIPGDRQNVDPSLIFASIDPETGGGRLALNGGPTPTVALRDSITNLALSGADPFDAGATDQRGFARPQPGTSNPDIGAFELSQRSLSTNPSVNNDVLSGSSAANMLAAREGNDLVLGNGGNDSLEGGPGSDTLRGGDGNDGLAGGFGNDALDGGAGQDRALYRLDTDRGFGLTIDLTAGTATSGSERDRLVSIEEVGGSIRDDTIIGNPAANAFLNGAEGQDFVFGRGGNDTVYGGPDDDQVFGEAGNDVLLGNVGADRLTGGAGKDRFDVDEGETGVGTGQRDLVLDFVRGSDKLDLAGIDADDDRSGNQAFAFTGTRAFTGVDGQLRYGSTSSRTLVQGDVDGDRTADVEIELAGRLSLAASDFVL